MKQKADQLIPNTDFSIQFVLDKVVESWAISGQQQRSDENGRTREQTVDQLLFQLDGFESEDITGGKAFMSSILRLSLHWRRVSSASSSQLPQTLIMKVPGPKHEQLMAGRGTEQQQQDQEEEENQQQQQEEEDQQQQSMKKSVDESSEYLIGAHKREILFYTHFPHLDPSIRLRLPRFYFGADYHPSHRQGLILMEDMSGVGVTVPVLPGFNDSQVLALLDELARVHVISWKHPEWEGLVTSNPIRSEFTQLMRESALRLKQLDPLCAPLVDRLLPSFTDQSVALSNYSGSKYGIPACLIHSDVWTPNVLWEMDSQGAATDRLRALIDWQCIHAGNPAEDLSRLLALNTPANYRRANTDRLLGHYAQLVAKHWGSDKPQPFGIDQLNVAYAHSLPFSAMFLCYGIPFYLNMGSVVGEQPEQPEINRAELLDRVRCFLEDTISQGEIKPAMIA